ncbi:MAG: N-formylglutamate amidohydrolase [Pseudomonadota bacterium]
MPIVLSSPHSGTHYEPGLLAQMCVSRSDLRPLEDGPVDLLLQPARRTGTCLVAAKFPRAFVDLNRAPDEIDRSLIHDWPETEKTLPTNRARAGLGIVPTHIGTRPIYPQPLTRAEIERRRDRAHTPYHRALETALRYTREMFGNAVLIDCHSMPEAATAPNGSLADISLGDRHGKSCSAWLVDLVEKECRRMGYTVSRNRPYSGGYITERYGKPVTGHHAIQLEIRRSLFMDEQTHRPNSNFKRVQNHLHRLVAVTATNSKILA